MNRNQVVPLSDLVVGDRFYKAGDKNKKKMAVRKIESTPNGRINTVRICLSELFGTTKDIVTSTVIKDPEQYMVVFLRHDVDVA